MKVPSYLVSSPIPWDKKQNFEPNSFDEILNHLMGQSCDGLYLFGTSGEGYAVSENEFSIPVSRTLFEKTRDVDVGTRQRADRFLKRPPEELYDILNDPYCQTNLFGQAQFSTVQEELATALERWMTEQGDSGRSVELEALDRQADWRKARNNPKPKKAIKGQK